MKSLKPACRLILSRARSFSGRQLIPEASGQFSAAFNFATIDFQPDFTVDFLVTLQNTHGRANSYGKNLVKCGEEKVHGITTSFNNLSDRNFFPLSEGKNTETIAFRKIQISYKFHSHRPEFQNTCIREPFSSFLLCPKKNLIIYGGQDCILVRT